MLGLLAVQFLLGMALNLYVTIPPFGAGTAATMRTGPLVMAHMMLGMVLAGRTAHARDGAPRGTAGRRLRRRWPWGHPRRRAAIATAQRVVPPPR